MVVLSSQYLYFLTDLSGWTGRACFYRPWQKRNLVRTSGLTITFLTPKTSQTKLRARCSSGTQVNGSFLPFVLLSFFFFGHLLVLLPIPLFLSLRVCKPLHRSMYSCVAVYNLFLQCSHTFNDIFLFRPVHQGYVILFTMHTSF